MFGHVILWLIIWFAAMAFVVLFILMWYLHFKVVPVFLGENSDWEPLQRILALCSGNVQDRKGGCLSAALQVPCFRAAELPLSLWGGWPPVACKHPRGEPSGWNLALLMSCRVGICFDSAMYSQCFWADAFPCRSPLKVTFALFPTRSGGFTKGWPPQPSLYQWFPQFPLAHTRTSSTPSASCATGLQMPSRPSWMFLWLELLPALPG